MSEVPLELGFECNGSGWSPPQRALQAAGFSFKAINGQMAQAEPQFAPTVWHSSRASSSASWFQGWSWGVTLLGFGSDISGSSSGFPRNTLARIISRGAHGEIPGHHTNWCIRINENTQ